MIKSQQDRYKWQNDIRIGEDLLQIVAEHLREEAETATTALNRSRTNDSLAIAYQMKHGKHIGSAGIRYDDNFAYGSEVTGSVGYGYHMTQNWRVNVSVGTSFREPTYNDLYAESGGSLYVNLDNKPEKDKNTGIGVYDDDGRSNFSAAYYRNDLSDMLVNANPCSNNDLRYVRGCAYNVGDALLTGLSFSSGTHFGNFAFRGTLDLQNAKDATMNKLLGRRARSHGSVSLNYLLVRLTGDGDLFFSGYRYDDDNNTLTKRLGDYTLLNLHATTI